MAAPKHEIIQAKYQNPHASAGLMLTMVVVSNTSDKDLERNIRANSAKDLPWVQNKDSHDGVAIMIGGGDSINDHIEEILALQAKGGKVFAMNGASKWARGHGINVDYQVIVDAKEETEQLVDSGAKEHLFGSQCNEKTIDKAKNLTLWHLMIENIETFFPKDRSYKGGYVMIGDGASAGNSGLCVAFSQGYRQFHVFGYDSSYRDGRSHAYEQRMNQFMPTTEVNWGGKTFQVSVGMKAQAEKFQITAQALKQEGCEVSVYGDGLLQAMYHTKATNLSEQEKYQLMWAYDSYRECSPGELQAGFFLNTFKPEGMILDFGCGTGRAGVIFHKAGNPVLLIDFADNCRDEEAQTLPFLKWDLMHPIPANTEYGYCTDVMEHIPTDDVGTVIENIMGSSENVFFQISTVDDTFGTALDIDACLHLTVKPHGWWKGLIESLGYTIKWETEQENASIFYITH